jgi:hypothetical protein
VATIGAIEDAIKDGSNWVLKPQREGGGNNLYGVELSGFLKKNREDPILSGINSFCPVHCLYFNILHGV